MLGGPWPHGFHLCVIAGRSCKGVGRGEVNHPRFVFLE